MSLFDWIVGFLEGADLPTEDESPRDGVFSYAVEWHAFEVGLIIGFAAFTPSDRVKAFVFDALGYDISGEDPRRNAMRQARQESWYAGVGLLVGAALSVGLQGVAVAIGLYVGTGAF